eukprot:SAG22_NODE_40_length_25739_cov_38.630031_4_plen_90_part_00
MPLPDRLRDTLLTRSIHSYCITLYITLQDKKKKQEPAEDDWDFGEKSVDDEQPAAAAAEPEPAPAKKEVPLSTLWPLCLLVIVMPCSSP